MKNFSLIIAVDNENWIWKDGALTWSIPEDMKHFKETTQSTQDPQKKNAVIMGRKTWESIPEKFRPLKWRVNCVLSSSPENIQSGDDTQCYTSLDSCLKVLERNNSIESIFIIGWAQLYNEVLKDNRLEKAIITRIYHKYHCDVFFHGLPLNFELSSRSEMKNHEGVEFEFSVYSRKTSFFQKIKKLFNK